MAQGHTDVPLYLPDSRGASRRFNSDRVERYGQPPLVEFNSLDDELVTVYAAHAGVELWVGNESTVIDPSQAERLVAAVELAVVSM